MLLLMPRLTSGISRFAVCIIRLTSLFSAGDKTAVYIGISKNTRNLLLKLLIKNRMVLENRNLYLFIKKSFDCADKNARQTVKNLIRVHLRTITIIIYHKSRCFAIL